jgi:omega-6 fatty acid desaturase (delta-12 desaturase)
VGRNGLHHGYTDLKLSWPDDKGAWTRARPFASTTVQPTFPLRLSAVPHHIMERTAHHVGMSIALHHLKQAQAGLEELLPRRIVVQAFSGRWYFDTERDGKLQDFTRRCWTGYRGRATGEPRALAA